jgi:hypothetical protein
VCISHGRPFCLTTVESIKIESGSVVRTTTYKSSRMSANGHDDGTGLRQFFREGAAPAKPRDREGAAPAKPRDREGAAPAKPRDREGAAPAKPRDREGAAPAKPRDWQKKGSGTNSAEHPAGLWAIGS